METATVVYLTTSVDGIFVVVDLGPQKDFDGWQDKLEKVNKTDASAVPCTTTMGTALLTFWMSHPLLSEAVVRNHRAGISMG